MNYSDLLQQLTKSPWLPHAVSSVLVIVIGWNVTMFALDMLNPPPAQIIVPEKKAKVVKTDSAKNLSAINLFGKSENQFAKKSDAPEKVTKLNLTLRGILAMVDDPSQGYAQIENAKKEERYFAVKDKIFGLATLEEIYVDRVIILHNGNYETLKLPAEFLNSKHFLASKLKKEQKKIVTDFRKLLVNRKGMELIKLFGFDTVYKNGGFYGFSIKVLGEEGQKMIDTLGVKEGDIIVAANGQRFAESIEAVNSIAKLKNATKINVEIDREGAHLFFDLEFDETAPAETPAAKSDVPQKNTNKQKIENAK